METKTCTLLRGAFAILALLAAMPPATARESSFSRIQRGRYLTYAGDCAACHTADGGKPFAGGREIPTPFGTIYSSNITPDEQTGIGKWTDEAFWRAMHEGIGHDGRHLYPAFPYPWYTKMTRDDVAAVKAYLDTLEPVKNEVKPPDLPFPMNARGSVTFWNALFFDPGTYVPDSNKSAQWNRGAYLVEGLAHCGACHTPKNALGGPERDEALQGGYGEHWFATNITGNPGEGLGHWTVDEIVEFLKTGATRRARAYGPMQEVVQHSTMHMSKADLTAMAVYLKDQKGTAERDPKPGTDAEVLARGRLVYADQCAACHMQNGEGVPRVFPPLKDSSAVQAHNPDTLIQLVLKGAGSAKTPERPAGFGMPAFDWKLTDQQIADLLTYLRASWGNRAAPVDASAVADLRSDLRNWGEPVMTVDRGNAQ